MNIFHFVKQGETLNQIARDYRTPLSTILNANASITNPNLLYVGQRIIIPGFPDPNSLPYHIHIFISGKTLRLLKDNVLQKTYPIAVGRILFATPVGNYIIINKHPNPGGPFGAMWMSLSKEHYGIHGTNDPSSIGKAVSRGCVRMHNQDVIELAAKVPIGTAVSIHP